MITLTQEQESLLRDTIPELNAVLRKDSKRELLFELDIAIVGMLDKDYNSTPESRKYQRLYDEILYNTPDDDE